MTTKYPPKYPVDATPRDIIGNANYQQFLDHFQFVANNSKDGSFPDAKISRHFTERDRKAIAIAYDRLRSVGFVPVGLNSRGGIIWSVVVKAPLDSLFDNEELAELKKMPIEKLQWHCRAGFRKMMNGPMGEELKNAA